MLLTDNLLLNYLRCARRAFLNVYGNNSLQDPEADFVLKLRQENLKYGLDVIANLTSVYHEPDLSEPDLLARAKETNLLMSKGVNYIYNGVLLFNNNETTFIGQPTLLIKQIGNSKFGPWNYSPLNIYLGRRPKYEYKILTTFHSYLLTFTQEILPPKSQFILRPYSLYSLNLRDFFPQLQTVLRELITMLKTENEPEVFISRQKCHLCRWYSHCKAIAKSQNHLSLIPGVTPNRYQHLQFLSINTVEALAIDTSPELGELVGNDIANQLRLQARSIVDKTPLRKTNNFEPKIPEAPVNLYFDIEAEPDRNLDYLLGVLVIDNQKKTEEFYPFLAKKPAEEAEIWREFLQLVNKYPEAPIFHYSNYEKETIKRLGQLYQTPIEEREKVLSRCIDLHHQVVNSVILPLENYSLKAISNWLGFTWKIPEARGDQSVYWYDQWLKTGNYVLLEQILSYNQDDCFATYYLKEWLVKFFSQN
jgi:predicted RecB family nuclease